MNQGQIKTVFFDVGNTLTYADLAVTLHPLRKRGLHASEEQLRFAEIEARVACGYGLDGEDLDTVFSDFTLDAVPAGYRALVRKKLADLSDGG